MLASKNREGVTFASFATLNCLSPVVRALSLHHCDQGSFLASTRFVG